MDRYVRDLSGDTYSVVLDRDGKRLQYELRWRPRSHEEGFDHLDHPDHLLWDLIDYDMPDRPGLANGAIWIPFLPNIGRAVYQVIHGQEVAFPIVLDER